MDGGSGMGDIMSKLQAKFGGQIPANYKDKLPPGIQDKLGGGDPSQLLNDPKIRELIKRGSNALTYAVDENIEAAMNKFNTK